MNKPEHFISLILGISAGFYTRDNFTYPYEMKVDLMKNDFDLLQASVINKKIKEESIILKMERQLEVLKADFIQKKN